MTKLEQLLKGGDAQIRFPDDVMLLKERIPELQPISDKVVQHIYENWSEECYSAGWMMLDDEIINNFAYYLREEVEEEG